MAPAAGAGVAGEAGGRGRAAHVMAVIARVGPEIAIGLCALLTGLMLWHLATLYNFDFVINFENVPSPLKVFDAFVTQLGDTDFYIHVYVSMRRILIGYALAVVLGVAAGVAMARSRFARAFIYPYIEILRPIPAVAWIPLAILMWPSEESSIVYITFLGALFPIVLNTMHGVEQTSESAGAGGEVARRLAAADLPPRHPARRASLHRGGLCHRHGVCSWFSLLAGEIISGQYGIGYFTWNAYSLINYPDIVVGMLMIGALGTLSTYVVRLAMRPLLAWQRRTR